MHCFTGCAVQKDIISDLGGISPSGTASPWTPIGKAFKAILCVKPGLCTPAMSWGVLNSSVLYSLSLCCQRSASSACVPESGLSPIPTHPHLIPTHSLQSLEVTCRSRGCRNSHSARLDFQFHGSQNTQKLFVNPKCFERSLVPIPRPHDPAASEQYL